MTLEANIENDRWPDGEAIKVIAESSVEAAEALLAALEQKP